MKLWIVIWCVSSFRTICLEEKYSVFKSSTEAVQGCMNEFDLSYKEERNYKIYEMYEVASGTVTFRRIFDHNIKWNKKP